MENNQNTSRIKILDLKEEKSLEIQNTVESDNNKYLKNNNNIMKNPNNLHLKKSNTEKNFFVYGKNSKQNNISKEKRLVSANKKTQNLTSYDNKFSNKITKTLEKSQNNRYSVTYINFENNIAEITKIKKKQKRNLQEKINNNLLNSNNSSNNNITTTQNNIPKYQNNIYSNNGNYDQNNLNHNSINNSNNYTVVTNTNTNFTNANIHSNNLNERNKNENVIVNKLNITKNWNFKEHDDKPTLLNLNNNLNINNISLKLGENKSNRKKELSKIKIKNVGLENKMNKSIYRENNNAGDIVNTNIGNGTFSSFGGVIKSKDFKLREYNKMNEKKSNEKDRNFNEGLKINTFKKEIKTLSDTFITINHCNNG